MFDPTAYSAMKIAGTITIQAVAANVAFVVAKSFDPNTGASIDQTAESVNLPNLENNTVPQLQTQIVNLQTQLASLQAFVADAQALSTQ